MNAKSLKIWFPGNERASLYVTGLIAPQGDDGFTGTSVKDIIVDGPRVSIIFESRSKTIWWTEQFYGMPYRAESVRNNESIE
jgi:hypothetical protein